MNESENNIHIIHICQYLKKQNKRVAMYMRWYQLFNANSVEQKDVK